VYVPKIVKIILDKLGLKDPTFSFLVNSTRRNKGAFIQALFDDEGHVDKFNRRLSLSSTSQNLIEILEKLLRSLDIVCRTRVNRISKTRKGKESVLWQLEITGLKNFIKFCRLIKPQHPEKAKDLDELLRSYEGKKMRTLRGETKGRILSLLHTTPMTIPELANKLNLTPSAIRNHIRKLKREGEIYPIKRVKVSNQKAILWSTKQKESDFGAQRYTFAQIAPLLLRELKTPKTLTYLVIKFKRSKGDIRYFLRRLKAQGLVKLLRVSNEGSLYVSCDGDFSPQDLLPKNSLEILRLLKKRKMKTSHIVTTTGLKVSNVRYHLQKLQILGLVTFEGKNLKIWKVI
jgi:predicted transcriptional regulator